MPAHRWWEQVVSVVTDEHGQQHMFSRKDVITDVANNDGGAHVASLVSDSYDVISQPGGILKITIGTEAGSEEVPIAGVHFVMLRQLGYEILHSQALLDLTTPKTIGGPQQDRLAVPRHKGVRAVIFRGMPSI